MVTLPRGARVLDALLTGRAWIALVGVLLAGIVFFNVDLLQMNREITRMADRAAELKRENARSRLDVARLANSERIQAAAARLGLVFPAPNQVRYLESNPRVDAFNASKRIIAPSPGYTPAAAVTAQPDPLALTPPATGAAQATSSPTSTQQTTTTTAPPTSPTLSATPTTPQAATPTIPQSAAGTPPPGG